MRRALFLVALLGLLAIGAGCSASPGGGDGYSAENAKYFTGTEGVDAHFSNFPSRVYYYGPGDNAGNQLTFGVELRNKGASFSRGAVFVSGFDPRMLQFQEIPILGGAVGACGLSIGTIGFGQVGGILRCDGVNIASSGSTTSVKIDNLGQFINALSSRFTGKKWLDPSKFDFQVQYEDNGYGHGFIINWNDAAVHAEYFQHGRLMIAVFSALDFIKYNGREFLLAGDTYEYPGGEYEYFIYNGQIVNWPPGLDETQQKFLLTTCYLYSTYASPIVCIDPEPYSENRKVCSPQSRSYGGGNGGPVAITSIEQENTPRKVIFHINVKNVGRGQVYDAGRLEKCSPYYPGRVTPDDLNVVYLGDVRIGGSGLATTAGPGGITCSPEVIRLDPATKTGTTTCTYPIEYAQIKSAYQAPLTVELWYGYSENEEKTMTIKRVI